MLNFRKSVRKLEGGLYVPHIEVLIVTLIESFYSDPYPFTHFFGIANTRQSCIDSAILVYERLMLKTPEY